MVSKIIIHYDTIGGIPANEYLREKKRERYHRIKESTPPEPTPVEKLSLDLELVNTIRRFRMQQHSYRAIARDLDISRYFVRRICKLRDISWFSDWKWRNYAFSKMEIKRV